MRASLIFLERVWKMKDWILKHKKLYFSIVFVVALALFMAITARGCKKLEKAYAATTSNGTYYPDLLSEVPLGDLQEQVETMVANNKYIVITKMGQTYYYVLSNEVLWAGKSGSCYLISGVGVYPIEYSPTNGLSILAGASSVTLMDSGVNYVIGSNYDYRYGWERELSSCPYNNLEYPTPAPVINYVYSDAGLYVTCNSVDNMLPCEYANTNIDECYWQYNGVLHNADVIDDNMLLQVTFEVKIPTREYLLYLIQNIPHKNYSYLYQHGRQFVKTWLDSPNYESYTFEHYIRYDEFSSLFTDGFEFSYRLSYADILQYLGQVNPNILDVYPSATLEDNLILALWSMHVFVDNTISLMYYDTGSDVYYGNSVINYYHYGQLQAVNVVVNADIFNSTEDELESVLQESIKEGYDELIKDSEDKVAELEQELDNINQQLEDLYSVGLGFGGELSGTNLWSGFRSLIEGLGGISATVAGFGTVVGAVFSFLPLQVASMISFTLVALCIIAIIKAVRG